MYLLYATLIGNVEQVCVNSKMEVADEGMWLICRVERW